MTNVRKEKKMQVQLEMLPPLDTITKTNFKCKKCGKCCRKRYNQLVLTPMDVFVISRYLGITREKFLQTKTMKVIGKGLPEITLKTYGKEQECCFFNKKNGCEIHEVSPFQCYTYPIIPFDEERGLCVQQPVHSYCGEEGDMKPVEEWLNESSSRYKNEKELRILWLDSLDKIDELCERLSIKWKERIFTELFLGLEDMTVEALQTSIKKALFYEPSL